MVVSWARRCCCGAELDEAPLVAGLLRLVARVLVWLVTVAYTQLLFGCMLQIAHAEHVFGDGFGSFWIWLFAALAASAVFHIVRISGRRAFCKVKAD